MTYTVEVTREGQSWIADVVDLPGAHTYAGNLLALDAAVREVIELVTDAPEGADVGPLSYAYLGVEGAFLDAAQLGDRRARAEADQAALADTVARSAAALAEAGYSQRDIAWVLQMSVGRVSQITRSDLRIASGQ